MPKIYYARFSVTFPYRRGSCQLVTDLLKPVHTGDYSRRFRRQIVAENGDCRRKVRLLPNSIGDSRRFRRKSRFSATVWTGLYGLATGKLV